jgi:ABC transporter with metal-binding/Fe-S-binding domain ATP-binding protein
VTADTTSDGTWVALFSGGKDSSWALYRALEAGLPVSHLLTVHPSEDSYMYHVPETRLTGLAAEAVGLDHVEVTTGDLDAPAATDAGAQGDREVAPLERALRRLVADHDVAGVTAGAVESEFQTARIEALCDRLGLDLFAPLYGEDPEALGRAMVDAGFEIRVLAVAAGGLDESWLWRRLDHDALDDLLALRERYGVHPLGEGGEFETLVVAGPHMDGRIEATVEREWSDGRGRVRVTDARLAQSSSGATTRE